MSATLLLSDLHLPAQPSPLRDAFIAFLEGPARQAAGVYILGDLFEYWIGDDIGLQLYAREVSRLAALSALGVPVHFMRGNRDFLVGRHFALITGATILRDPVIVELGGQPTLLSHGDLWCTQDEKYQHWRRFSRNPVAQWLFLRLPRALRERIAGGVRARSGANKMDKPAEIMDVDDDAVRAAFPQARVQRIIHGHTHRPARHHYRIGERDCERVVLADWTTQRMEYLRVDGATIERVPV
ncbi:MAG TPA: UDP-2,3-diacylglucosamine diphosphatase [Nevskiaceae bacterium]|nr:UDP-2,3-diacylglucosamine diphosphatase [Nevskiaceae bacterium]